MSKLEGALVILVHAHRAVWTHKQFRRKSDSQEKKIDIKMENKYSSCSYKHEVASANITLSDKAIVSQFGQGKNNERAET